MGNKNVSEDETIEYLAITIGVVFGLFVTALGLFLAGNAVVWTMNMLFDLSIPYSIISGLYGAAISMVGSAVVKGYTWAFKKLTS